MPRLSDSWINRLPSRKTRIEKILNKISHEEHTLAVGRVDDEEWQDTKTRILLLKSELKGELTALYQKTKIGLAAYDQSGREDALDKTWPTIKLTEATLDQDEEGNFSADSEAYRILQDEVEFITAFHEGQVDAEVRRLRQEAEQENRQREHEREQKEFESKTEDRRTKTVVRTGAAQFVMGALLSLYASQADSCRNRSAPPNITSGPIHGAGEDFHPVTISCLPALPGLSAVATRERYYLRGSRELSVPSNVVCTAQAEGRLSAPTLITLKEGQYSNGEKIVLMKQVEPSNN